MNTSPEQDTTDVPPRDGSLKETGLTQQPPPLARPAWEQDEKNWGLLAHVSTLSTYIGIPGFIGPLLIWLLKKDTMPIAAEHAKEALNFQISLIIYGIICVILSFTLILALVGIPGLLILAVLHIVFSILATIQAGEGKFYRYPLSIRLIP